MSGNGSGSSDECEDRSYDLTQPPTRDELGMPVDKSVLDVSCDAGFELSLTLPKGAATSMTARRVNADSYAASDPETGDPTTMDIHSVGLDVEGALQVARGVADDLGIDPKPLERWRRDVESTPDDSVDSPFMRAKIGYLTAELQVQHLGTSGTNYVHLILTLA